MEEKKHNSNLFQESNARGEKRAFEIYNNKFIKVITNNIISNNVVGYDFNKFIIINLLKS